MPLYTGENKQPPRDYTPHPNDIVSRNLASDAREDRIMGSAAAAWGTKRVADQWVRTSPTYDPSRGISQIFDKPIADIKDAITAHRNSTAARNVNFNPDPYRGMAPNNYPQIAPSASSKAIVPATQRIANDPYGVRSNANFTTKNRLKSTWKGVAGSTLNKLLALYVPYKFYQAHKTDALRDRYLNKEMTLQEVNNMRYERGITGRAKTAGTVDTFKGVSGRPGVQGVPSIKNSTSAAPKTKTAAEDLPSDTPAGKGALALSAAAGGHFGAALYNHEKVLKRRNALLERRDVERKIRERIRQFDIEDALWMKRVVEAPTLADALRNTEGLNRARSTYTDDMMDLRFKAARPRLESSLYRLSGRDALKNRNKYLKRGAGLLAGTAALGTYAYHDWMNKQQEKTAAQGDDLAVITLNDHDIAAKGAVAAGSASGIALLRAANSEHDFRMAKKNRRGAVLHAKRVNRDIKANAHERSVLEKFTDELREENLEKRLKLNVFDPDEKAAYDALMQERDRISDFENAKLREFRDKNSALTSLKYKLKTERKMLRDTMREAPKMRNKALTAAGIGGAAALGLGAYALHNDTQD
jgi:hypothetical protein